MAEDPAFAYLGEHAANEERAERASRDDARRPAIEAHWLADFECTECRERGPGVALVVLGEAPLCLECVQTQLIAAVREAAPERPIGRRFPCEIM